MQVGRYHLLQNVRHSLARAKGSCLRPPRAEDRRLQLLERVSERLPQGTCKE